jgi:hypothetical protein
MQVLYPNAAVALSAVHSDRMDRSPETQAVVLLRDVGPWGADLGHVHLPPEAWRREKRDRLLVVEGGRVIVEHACSTWPFGDRNPPTKAATPGLLSAAWLKGLHMGRPGLLGWGFTTVRGWVYDLNGTPQGRTDKITGWNLHSDEGISEACITTDGQAPVDDVRSHLHRGERVHPDLGRQCFDVYLLHVYSL